MPDWVDFAGHLSFILTAASFMLRDMLLLRSMAIASGMVGVVYNYYVSGGPLWLVIFWLCVFMAINVFQIVSLLLARRGVTLSEEEQELLDTIFTGLSPVEMMKLMRAGTWQKAEKGHTFATQGQEQDHLILLYSGEVQVVRDGNEIDRSRDGMFIGEMSFLSDTPANATVNATRFCRYVTWSQDDLRKLLRKNPSIQISLQQVFTSDLLGKLRQRAG